MQHLGLLHGSVLVNRQWGYAGMGSKQWTSPLTTKNVLCTIATINTNNIPGDLGIYNNGNTIIFRTTETNSIWIFIVSK